MNDTIQHVEAIAVAINDDQLALNVVRCGSEISKISNSCFNEGGVRDFLSSKRWPRGFQDMLIQNITKFPFRYFICDDSGSMVTNDGKKLVGEGPRQRMTTCSRWSELTDSLKFHVQLCAAGSLAGEFRMLNGSKSLRTGFNNGLENDSIATIISALDQSPGGGTPLCRHIREVIDEIRLIEPQLRANGQKACVIIATDGESSDGDIAEAMRPLQHLPVWVVVRLCTNEDRIVDYWNNIDTQLEIEMDVLDDLAGESEEVNKINNWLTYGEPLHRLREFGIPLRDLDMIDETLLSSEQMRVVCALIFGGSPSSFPHPEVEWDDFLARVTALNNSTPPVWSTIAGASRPWLALSHLTVHYGPKTGGCAIC